MNTQNLKNKVVKMQKKKYKMKGERTRDNKGKIDTPAKGKFMKLFYSFITLIYFSDKIITVFSLIFPLWIIKSVIFTILIIIVLRMSFLVKDFLRKLDNKDIARKFTASFKARSKTIIGSMVNDILGIPKLI